MTIHEYVVQKYGDPNRPNKPKTSFMLWCGTKHSQVRDDLALISGNGSKKVRMCDVSKELSAIWRELDDTEKAPFIVEAKEAMERYHREMETYKRLKEAEADSSKEIQQTVPEKIEDSDDEEDIYTYEWLGTECLIDKQRALYAPIGVVREDGRLKLNSSRLSEQTLHTLLK